MGGSFFAEVAAGGGSTAIVSALLNPVCGRRSSPAALRFAVSCSRVVCGLPSWLLAVWLLLTRRSVAPFRQVDVVKTRRQLERFRSESAFRVARGLWREGGVVALWRPGLTATVARERNR